MEKSKEINWTDVDFVATSASYFTIVAEQPNGAMNGLYCLNSIICLSVFNVSIMLFKRSINKIK